ncbi:MAG TPA: hypothetical protein VII37_05855, partial [Candidatus Acidoferrum sp.]
ADGGVRALPTNIVATLFAVALTAALVAILVLRAVRSRNIGLHPPSDTYISPGPNSKTYHVRATYLIAAVLAGGLLAVCAIACAWFFGTHVETPSAAASLGAAAALAILATGGVVFALDSVRSKLLLHTNALEIRDLFRVRWIPRDAIASRRILRDRYSRSLLLALKAPPDREIKLPMVWATDTEFDAWFAGIPDVDVVAIQEFEDSVKNDTALGNTPEERSGRLSKARRIAQWSRYAGIGAYSGQLCIQGRSNCS